MRILHVIRTLNPGSGGPPRVAVRLCAGQAAMGHDVRILTHRLTDSAEDFRAMTRLLRGFERVTVEQIPSEGLLERMFATQARPYLRRLVAGADIVHLHDVWDSLVRTAASYATRAGKPYVLQPNDSLNPWALNHKRWKKSAALALAYRRMIEGSAALLFGHREEQRLASQSGFRIRPVVAGLGGVFQAEVEPSPEPNRFYQRVRALRGRPFVVFLSRFHPKKGMDFLAEGFAIAARRVPELQLVVIGRDEGAEADFVARVARHRLTDRVHVVGPMHGAAKWEAYRDAVCFCLPSRDEAFTVAIVEALSCGLPVVISEACHFDEVGEYGAGSIVPLAADRIGEALTRLCLDRGLRDRMSRNARRLFEDRLRFDSVPDEVLEIYRGCLARSPATATSRAEYELAPIPDDSVPTHE